MSKIAPRKFSSVLLIVPGGMIGAINAVCECRGRNKTTNE